MFDIVKFYEKLDPSVKRPILYAPILSGTQTVLNTYFQNLDKVICICDYQESGIGRSGNSWENPYGCLTFSYKLSIKQAEYLPQIQYLISIAFIRVLHKIESCKNLDIAIKWPNDIFGKRKYKIGGILCQSKYDSNLLFDITCGFGINVSNKRPTISIQDLINEEYISTTYPEITREEILSMYFNEFDKMFEEYKIHGFRPLIPEYLQYWMHSGQEVNITYENSKSDKMKIKGVSESGYLIAVSDDGVEHELYPDGNRFDFFNGLLMKK